MRIAILTLNYYPEPDQRMHILASGLVARGHQVVVLTAFPNYPTGTIYPGYRQRLWCREDIDGVEVIRLPLIPDHSNSPLRRAISYFSFTISASLLGIFFLGNVDILIVYHPPATLAIPAWIFHSLRHTPFIFEVQDMWPDILKSTEMLRSPFLLKIVESLMMFAYLRATMIIVVTPGYRDLLISRGVSPDKIRLALNWAYEGDFVVPPYDTALAEQLGIEQGLNVVYAGNFGPAQGLSNILEAAQLLRDEPNIQFVLVGDGVTRPQIEEEVRLLNLNNVKLIPPLPISQIPRLYSISQAMLIHLGDDPLYAITIPGKAQSYLASGRPIIVAVKGDTAELILRAGAGVTAEPMNPTSLASAVANLAAMTEADRASMGVNGQCFYKDNLSTAIQIPRYEDLLRKALEREHSDS